MADTKLCPYCGEDVKLEAIKCKHCQSMLSEEDNALVGAATPVRPQEEKPTENKADSFFTGNSLKSWIIPAVVAAIILVYLFIGLDILDMVNGRNGDEPTAKPEEETAIDAIKSEEETDGMSFGEIAALTGELTEAEYRLWLPHHIRLVGDLFLDIVYYMDFNIAHLSDEDHYKLIIDDCRYVKDITSRAWNVQPPAEYEELHQEVLAGFTLVDEAMDALVEGIEEMDESKIEIANDKLEEGFSNYLDQVIETTGDWEYWDL